MKKRVTLGLIQTKVSTDPEANLKKTVKKVEEAAKKGAQIICLQELFQTRYFPQDKKGKAGKFAVPVPGRITKIFSELARKRKIVIVIPLFEKGADKKFYNSAVVIDANGKRLKTYRKIHIPHDPLFYEKSYFRPGNTGYQVYKTRYAKIGVLICYDQWYPEAARILALKGADIIFYPTAIGWIKRHEAFEGDWHNAWETVQRSHAIANGVHVAVVNRVGTEGRLQFWGASFVCDAFGNVLRRASTTNEETLIVNVDLGRNKRIRDEWGFLRNRRPDTYRPLLKK